MTQTAILPLALKMKTLFFIIDKALHGNVCAQEFLDIALMAAAFDQKVVLLFEADGVNALLKNQQAEALELKNITPILNALELYDIKEVLVEKESMQAWGLVERQLAIAVKVVSRCEIQRQINLADHSFSF